MYNGQTIIIVVIYLYIHTLFWFKIAVKKTQNKINILLPYDVLLLLSDVSIGTKSYALQII